MVNLFIHKRKSCFHLELYLQMKIRKFSVKCIQFYVGIGLVFLVDFFNNTISLTLQDNGIKKIEFNFSHRCCILSGLTLGTRMLFLDFKFIYFLLDLVMSQGSAKQILSLNDHFTFQCGHYLNKKPCLKSELMDKTKEHKNRMTSFDN